MNEENDNPFWLAFLIDFNFAIKEQQEGLLEVWGKTGIKAFMVIGVLLSKIHSAQHDFKLFFQVLFWIYIYYNRLSKDIGLMEFKYQNYKSDRKLAGLKKSIVDDEGDFLKSVDNNFLLYYQPLIL